MSYELTIAQKAGYLHGIATGQNSREAVTEYLMRGVSRSASTEAFPMF